MMLKTSRLFWGISLLLANSNLNSSDPIAKFSVFTKIPPAPGVAAVAQVDTPSIYRGTEFWGDQNEIVKAQDFNIYKSAVNRELAVLSRALENEGVNLNGTADDYEPDSPREKIKFMTSRVGQVVEVETIMAEDQAVRLNAEKWPGENLKWAGVCIASARNCSNLMKDLSTNGFACSVLGTCALAGAYLLVKRKS